tara:strand:- start:542 stop:706 length:165 start_codon:yes stop_codon:yes gene_type:complete
MKLIDIDKLERENYLLKLKLKEAHDWIRHMGDWDKYKKRSTNEAKHRKSTRDDI